MSFCPNIKLNNGVEIPQLGFGVWKAGDDTERAVSMALEAGYRHFDLAPIYENEDKVGRAFLSSGIKREELFITSKLWNQNIRDNTELECFQKTLDDLHTDYLDLYLIHWPVYPGYHKAWRILEELLDKGCVRAIGISNFTIPQMESLLQIAKVQPMLTQINFNPINQDSDRLQYCNQKDIKIGAWSPLGNGRVINNPDCIEIGKKYGKSGPQVILRWLIQKGLIIFPASIKKEEIEANSQIFDFELSDEDCKKINALNRNEYYGPDPNNVDF